MGAPDRPASERELQPARERRVLPLVDMYARASGEPDKGIIIRGHAAVFDRASLDLGGFTERIAAGAFAGVLDRNPDVHLVWDHDTSLVLARTRSSKYGLDLREDPRGLHFYANVAPTSYAKDLSLLMESGVVDQASFAFTVARDEWAIDDEEVVTRTILEVGELYDVTVTAQGAYPQTDTTLVAHMRSRLESEVTAGHLPDEALAVLRSAPEAQPETAEAEEEQRVVAEAELPGAETSLDEQGTVEGEQERVVQEFHSYRRQAHVEVELAKRRLLEAERNRE